MTGRGEIGVDVAADGRFTDLRLLGAGGFGTVYEAVDRLTSVPVALKVLHRLGPAGVYGLKQEFRSLADVSHPNLVALYELMRAGEHWLLVMERIDGCHLLEAVGARHAAMTERSSTTLGTIDEELVVSARPANEIKRSEAACDPHRLRALLPQLAAGLDALHSAGKLHRDVKPSNVLVEPTGRLVLLDFGLVTDLYDDSKAGLAGTPAYLAPEQIAGRATPASDWYSVGVVLYRALAGRLPFHGTAAQVLVQKQQQDAPPLRALCPAAPPDLVDLATGLLSRDPGARPTSADVVALVNRHARAGVTMPLAETREILIEARFTGRDRELATLAAWTREARDAQRVVVISGPAGIGKSAVVREVIGRIRRDEPAALIASGRCYERESIPYKAFDAIVDELARDLAQREDADVEARLPPDCAALVQAFPVMRRVRAIDAAAKREQGGEPEQRRARAFRAVRDLLFASADDARVVVHVDDLHWADPDSMALLETLLEGGRPMLLLATWRMDPGSELPESLAVSLGGALRVLELGSLDAEDTLALVRRLQVPADSRPAAELAGASGGHPLLLQELVRTRAAVATLTEAFAYRFSTLPDAARALLEAIAIAGEPLRIRHAAAVAGLDAPATTRALERLRGERLVATALRASPDAVQVYHARIADTIEGALPAPRRRELHGRLADVLLAHGAEHAAVRHLAAAGNRARAAVLAAAAGRSAAAAFAFDRASQLLGDALAFGTWVPAEERALRVALGDALACGGRGPEAAEQFTRAAVGASVALSHSLRRRAAEQLLISGHFERGFVAMRDLLNDLDLPFPRSTVRGAAQFVYERARFTLRGMRWREDRDIAPADVERLELFRALSFGLGMSDNLRGAIYQLRATRTALDLGDPRAIGRNLAAAAIFLGCLSTGSRERTRSIRSESHRIARSYPEPLQVAWADGADGILDVLGGRLRRGTTTLARVEDLFAEHTTGTRWELDSVRMFRYLGLRFLGELVQLRRLIDVRIREAKRNGNRLVASTLARALGLLLVTGGDIDAAERSIDEASWVPLGPYAHLQHVFELESRTNIALWRSRGGAFLDEAASRFAHVRRALATRIQVLRCVELWARGRLHVARGTTADLGIALAIAAQLASERVAYARPWAELVAAGALAASGATAAAGNRLRKAAASAVRADMTVIEQVAHRQLALVAGDRNGIAEADARLTSLGVADASSLARVAAPGFESIGAR